MANTYRGEIQDNKGNTVYPHTESEIVFCPDGENVQEKLTKYENALGNVTGTTDSLEVSDSNILATSKALNVLNENLKANDGLKFQFATDGEGNYGYLKGDDTFVPFKGTANMVYLGAGTSFNIKNMFPTVDYTRLSVHDFVVGFTTAYASGGTSESSSAKSASSTITKNYDNSIGVLTLSINTASAKNSGGSVMFSVVGQSPFACMYIK